MVKLDSNGNREWDGFGGTRSDLRTCRAKSADGGFLWAEDQTQVHRNRTKWGRALWIVKLRPNGEMDWGEFDGSLPP